MNEKGRYVTFLCILRSHYIKHVKGSDRDGNFVLYGDLSCALNII